MGSILQNGMFSESKLTACLAAIIAEVTFISGTSRKWNRIITRVHNNRRERESLSLLLLCTLDNNNSCFMQCIVLLPDISSRSLQFIYA